MLSLFFKPSAPWSVPENIRIYAIGDIHGRLDLLETQLTNIDRDVSFSPMKKNVVVFLGDYIDRGPESAGVLASLSGLDHIYDWIFLRGNHEAMLMQFLQNPATICDWAAAGGLSTMLSYGLHPSLHPKAREGIALARQLLEKIPEKHLRFLERTTLSYSCGGYFFAHAGVRPKWKLDCQSESDLLWIRKEFLTYDKPFPKRVVHGHSPVMTPDVRSNRINIDTGAFATGRLTCLVLEGDKCRFLS